MKNTRIQKTYNIAISSIFIALSVVFLYFGSLLDVLDGVAVIITSIFLIIVYEETSKTFAWMSYFAILLLSLFLTANKGVVIYFIFFGYYPILKYDLDRISNRLGRVFLKFIVLSISALLAYFFAILFLKVVGFNAEIELYGKWILIVFLIMVFICFVLYDIFLLVIKKLYFLKIKPKLDKIRN